MPGREEQKAWLALNYYPDQQGIISRYVEEKEHWDIHLGHTRAFITETLGGKGYKTISVLGSGWLLDLPVEFLASTFQKVILYDIYHPPQVVRKLRNYSCFEFRVADLTGGVAQQVFTLCKKRTISSNGFSLETIECPLFPYPVDTDYYISLNIIDQLDSFPADYLLDKADCRPETLSDLRRRIQTAHLDSLPKGRSCIIADRQERVYSLRDGDLLAVNPLLLIGFPSSPSTRQWDWMFDSRGAYYTGARTVFDVLASEL